MQSEPTALATGLSKEENRVCPHPSNETALCINCCRRKYMKIYDDEEKASNWDAISRFLCVSCVAAASGTNDPEGSSDVGGYLTPDLPGLRK